MSFRRSHHQHPRHRLDGVHEAAVVERDTDLVGPEVGEEGLLARDMPSAISRTVGQYCQIAALAVVLKPAGREIGQFIGGKGSHLVEDIALRELTCVEKGVDMVGNSGSQCHRKKCQGHRITHYVFERRVAVIVAAAPIYLLEIGQCKGFVNTNWSREVAEDLAGPINNGLHCSNRRRATTYLQPADC